MSNKRVLIVGAGPGGLSCGMILAQKGLDVTIIDRADRAGGRNASFNLADYTFDIGPTFFLMKDVLEDIFEQTGLKLENYIKLQHVDPMYRLAFSEEKAFYPSTDDTKMKEELERVFPGSSSDYDRYMTQEKKKYDKLIPCLQLPYDSITSLLKTRFIGALRYLDAHVSLFDVLGRYFKYEELKLAFTFQAKYIGMSPWKAPGTFSIISYIEHGGGIWHVEGGLNQLSAGMAKAYEDLSGKLQLSTEVAKINVENGKSTGVTLSDGTQIDADYVVINADFGYAMTKLVDEKHRKKFTDKKLASKEYSCSTFMLYLGLNHRYEDLPHHNIIFADDYRENVSDITDRFSLGEDLSFYVQNACIMDPSLAPESKSTLYVLVPAPNNNSGIDWEARKPLLRERVLDLLETRGGFSNIRQYIEAEKIITPTNWEDDFNVYKGAVFNLGHQIKQMLFLRPHNRFECFKNCYLVGGGTHPGSGLPTIYESGKISAELLCKDAGIA